MAPLCSECQTRFGRKEYDWNCNGTDVCGFYDFTDLVSFPALGLKGKGLILMNHGLLTVGKTCDEAGYLFRLMEKSCKIQLEVDAAAANGLKRHIISDEEAAYNFKMASESVSPLKKSGSRSTSQC